MNKQQLIEKYLKMIDESDKDVLNPVVHGTRMGVLEYVIQDLKSLDEVNEGQIDEIASYMHDTWSQWFIYQHHNSTPENVLRWTKQSETSYKNLSEEDKEKDRKFAREILERLTSKPKEEVEVKEVLAYESGYKAGYEDCKNGKKSLIVD